MFRAIVRYVKIVDTVNHYVGAVAMYMIFAMLGILLYSSISKTFFLPAQWTLEMAQFTMAAYYMLGGGRSMQMHAHVRMDLLYVHWQPHTRAWIDSITVLFLIFYLIMLLYGGISSTHYALKYDEQSYSAWAPYMAPIKIVMVIGIILMLLQAIAAFFRNVAEVRGIELK